MLSRTLDLDGPVHVADFGGAGPTMVLVHGLGGSHANWLAVGPALAAHARVLAPDLPGFGRTPLAGRSAHVHAGVALVDSLLDTVADGPAILVGNSMGGLIAMMQAAACPEKVAGLVLVGPAQPRPRRGRWRRSGRTGRSRSSSASGTCRSSRRRSASWRPSPRGSGTPRAGRIRRRPAGAAERAGAPRGRAGRAR